MANGPSWLDEKAIISTLAARAIEEALKAAYAKIPESNKKSSTKGLEKDVELKGQSDVPDDNSEVC